MAYRFADFEFDPDCGLSRSGRPVALEPLAAALLHYLIENRGRIVGRDELNDRLWDGRFVSDAALSTQVRGVRRALGDNRALQRFIRTHPRRGISFVADVEQVGGVRDGPATAGTGASRETTRPTRAVQRRVRPPWMALGALAVLGLVAVAVWTVYQPESAGTPPSRDLSLAVLPFENLSGDGAQDYLADAFTEDLITDLSRIRDAFVISRSTMFTYRGRDAGAAEVARELGVRYVLEGSLRITGDSVRINAQLIDGASNSHLWSDRYDRPLADLFALRDNVTGQIASVLRAELRVADTARQDPELSRDAWDYALRGNVILYNHETVADYQQAHALLTRAVTLDPSIASAWAGLAFVHYVASVAAIPDLSQPDSADLSLEAALNAVEADPMNAEAWWLVGAGYARTGQPEIGMAACDTAIDLNPNMDCGYVCAALVHMALDEPEQAVPHLTYALELNPLFRPFTKEKYLGLAYIQSGENGLAIEALNRALSMAPRDGFANLALAAALALDGQSEQARETLQRFTRDTGGSPQTIAALRATLDWMGPQTERMLDALRDLGLAEG